MSPSERSELAEFKVWMLGEDGTGGMLGELRTEVKTLRSDMAFIKGAVKMAAFVVGFLGVTGVGWLLLSANALVQH